jgi:putative nucleotidyltransferase with HDIG domain
MKILLYMENVDALTTFSRFLKGIGLAVVETTKSFDVLDMIKDRSFTTLIASKEMAEGARLELKDVVAGERPDMEVLFMHQSPLEEDTVSVLQEEFGQFLKAREGAEQALMRKNRQLNDLLFSMTDRLLQLFEVDNEFFFNNDQLVAELSVKIAQSLGLDEGQVQAVRFAALLKDIGKVGVQDDVIKDTKRLKSDDLTPIKMHPINSVQILRGIDFPWDVQSIIAQHHENFDGTGYPLGIGGADICVGAHILHIADSFVAMTTDRPYRKALEVREAAGEIRKQAGTQYDPDVVDAFFSILDEGLVKGQKKKGLLVIERHNTMTALLRLSLNASNVQVMQAASSLEAMRAVRRNAPALVVFDIDVLDAKTAANFLGTMAKLPSVKDKPFVFIIPEGGEEVPFEGTNNHYVSRPVDMNELVSLIMNILDEKPEDFANPAALASGMTGEIAQVPIADIVQIMHMGHKTGRLEVVAELHAGEVYFRNGEVYFVRTESATGDKAFFDMFSWSEGHFEVSRDDQFPPEGNLSMDTTHLLMEAARVRDERMRMRAREGY